jgi:hypothetical protein
MNGKAYVTQDRETIERLRGSDMAEQMKAAANLRELDVAKMQQRLTERDILREQERAMALIERSLVELQKRLGARDLNNELNDSQKSLNDAQRDLEIMVRENLRMKVLIERKAADIEAMQKSLMEADKAVREADRTRESVILNEAVRSGKAQVAP